MNLAADVGRHSGRATPSLHDTPHRHFEETTGRQSTYLLPITVQTNRTTFGRLATSSGGMRKMTGGKMINQILLTKKNKSIK
jgi:hypothetical protein